MFRTALLALSFSAVLAAREAPSLPADPHFAPYSLDPAPVAEELVLKKGDRLAICGDSITEQKRYSLIMEAYLTACVPELEVTCRQYGWGGETAEGFLKRMENDVLRFEPDVATTCYGMNDFRYVPFEQTIADAYVRNQTEVVRKFKQAGCEVVLGSPGIIDGVPHWQNHPGSTPLSLNQSLSEFRNLDVALAAREETGFADVFQPMLIADWQAKKAHGPDFKVAGKDGVHPGWAGHLTMAYAFLKGLGFDGDLGGITLHGDRAQGSGGHQVKESDGGTVTIVSTRFPFSAGPGDLANDDSLRAGLALVPFDTELNRFTLRLEQPSAARYAVTWGEETRDYDAAELEQGINLAADFVEHPLLEPFRKVWAAAERKQNYETRQIKDLFHGPEAAIEMETIADLTEKVHSKLVAQLAESMQPVEHQITVKALP